MKTYTTNGPVQVSTGRVRLDESQARRRRHYVKHVQDDIYEITRPFEFKGGETFGYDGVMPKSLVDVVQEAVQEESPKEPVEEDPKPKAKAKTSRSK